MKGIFDAITGFFSTIGSIIEFVFKAIGMLITLLTNGISFLGGLIGLLPAPFVAGALILVIVCVLYKVLGRENQS